MNNEEPTSSVRRVSVKDRKARLEPVEPLFPEEAQPAEPERFPPVAPRVSRRTRQKARAQKSKKRGFTRQDGIALLFLFGTIAFIVYFALLWIYPDSSINLLPRPTLRPIYVTATPSNITYTGNFKLVESGVLYGLHPSGAGCDRRAIAGTVSAGDGFQIKVTGQNVENTALSGSISLYGTGGFEVPLPDATGDYIVQLFDMQNTPRSAPISVTISESCDLNLAVVNFVED